jgi:trehalose 6-phosphate phosphatase
MPGSGPAPPPREVRRLLAPLLADPPRTAIVSDFDGTLSPIVDHPADARPLPGSGALLRQLAHRFGLVAVVSGRPVSFLIEHLATAGPGDGASGGAGPKFIGLYGMEQSSADGTTVPHPDAVAWRPVLDAATDRLRAGAPDGAFVESKGLAVTVHWRTARAAESWASTAIRDEVERTGLQAHAGRRSLELRPPLSIDKGTVLERLLEGRTAACYFGDDLGDLPAFAALAEASRRRGIVTVSVAVADDESPPQVLEAADVVVRGPGQAVAALHWLAEAPRTD